MDGERGLERGEVERGRGSDGGRESGGSEPGIFVLLGQGTLIAATWRTKATPTTPL